MILFNNILRFLYFCIDYGMLLQNKHHIDNL